MSHLPTDADREWLERELAAAIEGRAPDPEPRTAYEKAVPWIDLAARVFAALGRGLREFGRFMVQLEVPAQFIFAVAFLFVVAFTLGRCA